jgi:hypothetical protein
MTRSTTSLRPPAKTALHPGVLRTRNALSKCSVLVVVVVVGGGGGGGGVCVWGGGGGKADGVQLLLQVLL